MPGTECPRDEEDLPERFVNLKPVRFIRKLTGADNFEAEPGLQEAPGLNGRSWPAPLSTQHQPGGMPRFQMVHSILSRCIIRILMVLALLAVYEYLYLL